jgi:predicted transcriptional regulator
MKNRVVGFLIIGVAALIGFIIYSFNLALVNIVNAACAHGASCPMWGTIEFQTNVSIGIMVFVVMIGFYLIFFGKEERVVTKIKTVKQQLEPKRATKENYRKIMSALGKDDRQVFEKILEAEGTMFQSELVEKSGLSKVKVTRILDRLEGKGLVERKRRGMTNVVILKH